MKGGTRRAAIIAPVRTGIGAFGGSLRNTPVEVLAAKVITEVLRRSGVAGHRVEDVVFAHSYPSGEAPCVGRFAALTAGLPVEVPGMQLDRRCGGGLQAIVTAAMMVQTGAADIVLAGGVESMSNIEYYTTDMRWGRKAGSAVFHDRLERARERSQPVERFGRINGMIETAENVARAHGITREQSDAFAVTSHQRAAAAWAAGRFDAEVLPVDIAGAKGAVSSFAKDEGIRPDSNVEALAKLRPVMPSGVVTAGNSSQQNDAAAACLVVAEDVLHTIDLPPSAYLAGWAVAGCEPGMMGMGPVPAVQRVMNKTGLSLDAMDLVELNEAFACQALAVLKAWGWHDPDRLNVNGSGISLGHPIGATGARIMTTLLHELERRKGRYGLETMCIGGGQGIAAIFERA